MKLFKRLVSTIGATLLTGILILSNPINIFAESEGEHYIDEGGYERVDVSSGDNECLIFVYVEDNIQLYTLAQEILLMPVCSLSLGDNHYNEKFIDYLFYFNEDKTIEYSGNYVQYYPFQCEEVATLTYGKVYMFSERVVDGYYSKGIFDKDFNDYNANAYELPISSLVRCDGSTPIRWYSLRMADKYNEDTKLTDEDRDYAFVEFQEWAREWDKKYAELDAYVPPTTEENSEAESTVINVEPETTTEIEVPSTEEVTSAEIIPSTEKVTLPKVTPATSDEEENGNFPILSIAIVVIVLAIVLAGVIIVAIKVAKKQK